jgi:hypothetical protein
VPQTCRLLPEHCVVPGLHDPVHTPDTHVEFVHGDALPNVPFGEHVSTPLLLQVVSPGAQLPTQAPPMQVAPEHPAGVPHVPSAAHTSTLFPRHCFEPGEHATHVLFRQLGVSPEHVD